MAAAVGWPGWAVAGGLLVLFPLARLLSRRFYAS